VKQRKTELGLMVLVKINQSEDALSLGEDMNAPPTVAGFVCLFLYSFVSLRLSHNNLLFVISFNVPFFFLLLPFGSLSNDCGG
jgi:hypothetical protein